ncbi:MAG: MlaD family protein [Herbaspirillum sp.]
MTDPTPPSPGDDLPQAVTRRRSRWAPSIVWLIPVIAIVVGGWLAVRSIMNQGPTVTIHFRTAEGLQTGQTRIKFRDVDIGVVKSITIAPGKPGVEVHAELSKQIEDLLVTDAKFWVVKPRVAGSGVSGLTTLLSGAYIGMEAGKSEEHSRDFTGLEVPPVLTEGLPGRTFVLRANDLGSLDYGSPVYYRRIEVGEVVAYQLDQDGSGVSIDVFVRAPYDKYVTDSARFWEASGIDFTMNAGGINVDTQSLASVLLGGIAFSPLDGEGSGKAAAPMASFRLYGDRATAFKRFDSRVEYYELLFRESVHGLSVGAPVEFRGIPIGEVTDIGLDYDREARRINIPVEVRLYPDRLTSRMRGRVTADSQEAHREFGRMIEGGLRGQLRTGSLITGQLYVALDFFPKAEKVKFNIQQRPAEIPTVAGDLQELQTTLSSIAGKIDKIPFEQLSTDLHHAINSLDTTLKSSDALLQRLNNEVAPGLRDTLQDARKTLDSANRVLGQDSPTQSDLRDTLREVSRAAASVRTLTDYLDRHPEALIRGRRPEDTP